MADSENIPLQPTPQSNNKMLIEATSDEELMDAWLQMKACESTREEYSRYVFAFLDHVKKSVVELGIDDLHAHNKYLRDKKKLALPTRRLRLSAVRSLLKFAQSVGYIALNPGAAFSVKAEKGDAASMKEAARASIAKRYLTDDQILKMIEAEENPRNKLLIRLLYISAARVSEILNATWGDVVKTEDGGQIVLVAKGRRIVTPYLSQSLMDDLMAIKGNDDEPIFVSRQEGKNLGRKQVWRIVKKAAMRIGASADVSPHWLRHSHASNSLAEGATVAEVKEQLGHKSLASTSIYVHAAEGKRSANRLGVK